MTPAAIIGHRPRPAAAPPRCPARRIADVVGTRRVISSTCSGRLARHGDRGARRCGQRTGARVAVGGVLRHALGDDGVERGAHGGVDDADAPRRCVEVRVHERGQVVTDERLLRREALEEHARQGVHVGARVDGMALEALGGHVVEGADGGAGHRQLGPGVADGVRDAEVDDVDEVVGGDEHVAGLDVAVHDAVGVRGVERFRDLGDQADGPLGLQRAAARDQRAEVRRRRRGACR